MDRMTESRSLSVINAAISARIVQSLDCVSQSNQMKVTAAEMVAISLTS
jgi:hypothetical protein